MIAALAFALPLALYLCFPSCQWNFDGVACAAALEIGAPLHFFHSQHLIFGLVGFLFWKTLTLLSHQLRALPALQICTSLLSALGALGIYTLIRRWVSETVALLTTLLVSTCAVVWVWSLEVQVYPIGYFALAFATATLLGKAPSKEKYRAVGFWHALAVLGHVIHFLWLIPAIYWICRESRNSDVSRKEALTQYGTCLIVAVGVCYAVVIAGVEWPTLRVHPGSFGIWFRGSAGLSADHRFAWHWPGWSSPLIWTWTSLRFFWGALWPYDTFKSGGWTWVATALSVGGITTTLISSGSSERRDVIRFALLWIFAYGVFFWTWEPATECYRLSDAVPMAILLALGISRWSARIQRIALPLMLLTTATANFATRIGPMHDPRRNAFFMETIKLARSSESDSLYLAAGSTSWLYLLYFTGRPAWNASAPSAQPVLRAIETFHGQRHVYVERALLQDPVVGHWLEQFKLQPVSADLPWLKLL